MPSPGCLPPAVAEQGMLGLPHGRSTSGSPPASWWLPWRRRGAPLPYLPPAGLARLPSAGIARGRAACALHQWELGDDNPCEDQKWRTVSFCGGRPRWAVGVCQPTRAAMAAGFVRGPPGSRASALKQHPACSAATQSGPVAENQPS
jgi:hypothetical protein